MGNVRYFIVFLVALSLGSCTKVWHTAQSDYTTIRMDSTAEVSSKVQQLIEPYKVQLDAEMNKVIAVCTEDMPKGRPESTLGNWMSDAILDRANVLSAVPIDFAMQNAGGIRIPMLREGNITKGKIFELMPFDNALVVVHLDMELLMQFLDRVAESGGWPVSKNFYMKIKNDKASVVKINNEPITERIYNVALPDYIANGGSDCPMLIGCDRTVYPVLLRDVFVEKATEDGIIRSKVEGRIVK